MSDYLGGIMTALGAGAIAAWCLYRKANVRAYFEARSISRTSRVHIVIGSLARERT